MTGRADYWASGDWNTVCFECGRKRKASELKKHWQGYYVCPEHWEARQPQDFVRAVPDNQTPEWVQPMPADLFGQTCTPEGSTAIPELSLPGCMIPARTNYYWDLGITGQLYRFCPIGSVVTRAGQAAADCAIVGTTQ